eukprot:872628-Prymnesium_polylepis.2
MPRRLHLGHQLHLGPLRSLKACCTRLGRILLSMPRTGSWPSPATRSPPSARASPRRPSASRWPMPQVCHRRAEHTRKRADAACGEQAWEHWRVGNWRGNN